MSADLIGDDACREAFNKARQQRFSVHGLDVVCEPDIFRAGYAAGRDSEIAKRDARIVELEHRCGVYGLELHNATERLQQAERQIKAIKAHEPAFMWHKGATEDESEVVDVDCACPCCVPLYAAPAAPAADAGLVEALELAANRLDRLALEQGEFWRGYATAWADEARAAHRAKGVV